MWRTVELLNVSDSVDVHIPGNVDRDHLLAKGLSFAFVPLYKAGPGDTKMTTGQCSLRGIIKEHEVVFISGQGLTHEYIIKAIAQQMGSAHEDEGVEPLLAELSEIYASEQDIFSEIVTIDANFVLEVGERVFQEVERRYGYTRKKRRRMILEEGGPRDVHDSSSPNLVEQRDSVPREGTLITKLIHPHSDWSVNNYMYRFPPLLKPGRSAR